MESRIIGFLDDNADGKVEMSELRGSYAALKTRFAALDLNHDGGLDLAELTAANLTRATARRLAETDIEQ
jgi:Ca2+-binding EF-hand superfamily protein